MDEYSPSRPLARWASAFGGNGGGTSCSTSGEVPDKNIELTRATQLQPCFSLGPRLEALVYGPRKACNLR